MTKKNKDSVDYSEGDKEAHCGICRHFIEAASCELVEGVIFKSMWCRLFEKARKGKSRYE